MTGPVVGFVLGSQSDLDQLDGWIRRAATIRKASELFEAP